MMHKSLWFLLLSAAAVTVINANDYAKKLLDCNDGSAQACLEAGKIYSAEGYKEKDYNQTKGAAKVTALYKRSCELGLAEGCTAYAMIYTADTHKDPNKDARYYFQKGCDGGDLSACTMLKMMPERQ